MVAFASFHGYFGTSMSGMLGLYAAPQSPRAREITFFKGNILA
jgi:hypothetical protein